MKVNIRGENKMCLGGADSSAVLVHINGAHKDMNFHNLAQNFRLWALFILCLAIRITLIGKIKSTKYARKTFNYLNDYFKWFLGFTISCDD